MWKNFKALTTLEAKAQKFCEQPLMDHWNATTRGDNSDESNLRVYRNWMVYTT